MRHLVVAGGISLAMMAAASSVHIEQPDPEPIREPEPEPEAAIETRQQRRYRERMAEKAATRRLGPKPEYYGGVQLRRSKW